MSLSGLSTDIAALRRYQYILAREFGVQPTRIEAMRGGWSARAFLVETLEKRYFLKVYNGTQQSVLPWIGRIDRYIGVLGWLAKTAELHGRIVAPVSTPYGEYKIESGKDVYLLYDFVEGATPGTLNGKQLAELANILASLHSIDVENLAGHDGLREDISLGFCVRLDALLDEGGQGAPGDFLRSHKATLRAAIDRTFRLRDSVRLDATPCSLCHTDAHGNNVIQGDRLVLADWEGLCIAPVEADLFMYAGDPGWDTFIGAYRLARPGFVLNEEMLRFYQSRRYLEDIWYYLTRLLHDHPGERETDEVYIRLRNIISLVEKAI